MEKLPSDREEFKGNDDYDKELALNMIKWVGKHSDEREALYREFEKWISNVRTLECKYGKKSEVPPTSNKNNSFDAEAKCEIVLNLDNAFAKYGKEVIIKGEDPYMFTGDTDIFVKAYMLLRRIHISHGYYCKGRLFDFLKVSRYKKDVVRVMDFVHDAKRGLEYDNKLLAHYEFTLSALTEDISKRYPIPDEYHIISAIDTYIVEVAKYVCEKQKILGNVDPSAYESIMDILAITRVYLNTLVCDICSKEAIDCSTEVNSLINSFMEKDYRDDFKDYSALIQAFEIVRDKWTNCIPSTNKMKIGVVLALEEKSNILRDYELTSKLIGDILDFIYDYRNRVFTTLRKQTTEKWNSIEKDEAKKLLELQKALDTMEISEDEAKKESTKYIEQTNVELRQILSSATEDLDAFSKIDIIFVILDAVQDKYCLAKQNVDVKAVLTILSDLKSIDLNCLIDIYSGCARQDCLDSFMDKLDRLYKKYSETGGNDG